MVRRKLLQVGLLILAAVLVVAPAMAASVINATFRGDLVCSNSSGDTLSKTCSAFNINTQALIGGDFVTEDLLNTAVQTPGGDDVAYMPGVGTNPWIIYSGTIGPYEQKNTFFYTGGPAMQTGFSYFPDTNGMATLDSDSLELGNTFEIEQKGYIDTSITTSPFPTIVAVESSDYSGTSHTVDLPSGIESGDLLLVFFTSDGAPTITFPGGWTELFNTANGSAVTSGCWYRIADGTEGSTISVTTSVTETSAHLSYRIIGYYGIPVAGTAATGSSANPDPPSLSPSFWETQSTLWIAVCGYDGSAINVTDYPTGYWDGFYILNGVAEGCGTGSARRELNVASEDPGTFTLSSSDQWVANTVAVPSGGGKNLIQKSGIFRIYVNAAESIRATIMEYSYPTVEAVNQSYGNPGTSHTVSLPAGITSGDLLLVFFAADGIPTITFPNEGTDWIQLFETVNDIYVAFGAWYRIADGGEGSTITVTTSVPIETAHISYRIANYSGVPEVGTAATGTSNLPDPPSLTPSWGSASTLWLACEGNDHSDYPELYPTDYTDGHYRSSGDVVVGVARRELEAANEDPGPFTLISTEQWIANTVAIQPSSVSITATGVSPGVHTIKVVSDVWIGIMRPSGVGTYTEFEDLVGEATHWETVDEVTPDDAVTYVGSDVANARDTFALSDVDVPDGYVIQNVTVYEWTQREDMFQNDFYIMIRSNVTDAVSSEFAIGSTWAYRSYTWDEDPDTSAAWTETGVNTMEAGAKVSTGVNVSQVYVVVTASLSDSFKIYVDGELKDSDFGLVCADNDSNWVFLTDGSMIYMDYHKISVGGTLKQHIVYERDTTFTGQAVDSGSADSGSTTTLVDDTLTQADDYWNNIILEIVTTTDGEAPQGESATVTDYVKGATGTADSGTTITLVDDALTQGNDHWNNIILEIVTTTDGLAPQGETTTVTDFTSADDTLHFAALTAVVDAGDTYKLYTQLTFAALTAAVEAGDTYELRNDATPTFRTTSSASISTTFDNYGPISEAVATITAIEDIPGPLDDVTPTMPPEMYGELNTEHLPGASLINEMLGVGGIPQALFWIPFVFGLAALAVLIAYKFARSMVIIFTVGLCIVVFFALTGGGVVSFWAVIEYVVIGMALLVAEKHLAW